MPAGTASADRSRFSGTPVRVSYDDVEADAGRPDSDRVAVLELVLAHRRAVDVGAVRGTEVDNEEAGAEGADLGVAAADVGVGQRDLAVRQAADDDGLLRQGDALAGGQDERARLPTPPLPSCIRLVTASRPARISSSRVSSTCTGPMNV